MQSTHVPDGKEDKAGKHTQEQAQQGQPRSGTEQQDGEAGDRKANQPGDPNDLGTAGDYSR